MVAGRWLLQLRRLRRLRIRYADYEYWLRGKRAQTAYRSIVLFELPIDAPKTSISRENVLTRTADAAGVEDIDFESEEFNRAYRVSSEDPKFARALVDARMMAWLLDEAKHSGFELRGSTMLVYYLLFTDPNDLEAPLKPGSCWVDARELPLASGGRWPGPRAYAGSGETASRRSSR